MTFLPTSRPSLRSPQLLQTAPCCAIATAIRCLRYDLGFDWIVSYSLVLGEIRTQQHRDMTVSMNPVVLAAQLFCWTGQFIGHGVFEKRAPALLDNLAQAFLMAPFFVLLEVLQTFLGYEPYPGFHARVSAEIDANRKEWAASKGNKAS